MMTAIKVKFNPSTVEGKEGTIFYKITHKRRIKLLKSKYKIFSSEWDEFSSEIRLSAAFSENRKSYLMATHERIVFECGLLKEITETLPEQNPSFNVDDIVSAYHNLSHAITLSAYMSRVIAQLKKNGKARTSETYTCTLSSFMRYRNNCEIAIDNIDSDLMQGYETWLKNQDLCMNTISFYMRILRAVYNRAVDKGITIQRWPFKHVYTGIDKTVKRAVPIDVLKKIKQLKLYKQPSLKLSRDLFLFSFYTRGMSFVDMAYLKKKNLNNGILSYRRKKTGQQMHIKWEKCMQEIVDKYAQHIKSPYLLPIISNPGINEREQYRNAILSMNKNLKHIGKMVELQTTLSTYVARHSWANLAKEKNIPIYVISEGMGHNSEKTTRIYLDSLNATAIDEANTQILMDL